MGLSHLLEYGTCAAGSSPHSGHSSIATRPQSQPVPKVCISAYPNDEGVTRRAATSFYPAYSNAPKCRQVSQLSHIQLGLVQARVRCTSTRILIPSCLSQSSCFGTPPIAPARMLTCRVPIDLPVFRTGSTALGYVRYDVRRRITTGRKNGARRLTLTHLTMRTATLVKISRLAANLGNGYEVTYRRLIPLVCASGTTMSTASVPLESYR